MLKKVSFWDNTLRKKIFGTNYNFKYYSIINFNFFFIFITILYLAMVGS